MLTAQRRPEQFPTFAWDEEMTKKKKKSLVVSHLHQTGSFTDHNHQSTIQAQHSLYSFSLRKTGPLYVKSDQPEAKSNCSGALILIRVVTHTVAYQGLALRHTDSYRLQMVPNWWKWSLVGTEKVLVFTEPRRAAQETSRPHIPVMGAFTDNAAVAVITAAVALVVVVGQT